MDNNDDVALIYSNLACVYDKQGNHELAETYYNKALERSLAAATPKPEHIAIFLNNLSMLYGKQKRYSEALEMLEKVIHKCEELQDAQSLVSQIYNNIGKFYHALNDDDKAIEYLSKALEIQQNIYPSLHAGFAVTYNNLADA
ncbi:unnamed protein product, partial [Rotaria sordida]